MKTGKSVRQPHHLLRLDAIDRKIITELVANGRIPLVQLGRRVNLSPPAVAERVQRLEKARVITGYKAVIDAGALGYALKAIIRIKPAPAQLARIPELAVQIPEVVECHRITGEDCFYIKVCLRAIDDLSAILDRFLTYGETTTSIVTASPIPDRDPPVLIEE